MGFPDAERVRLCRRILPFVEDVMIGLEFSLAHSLVLAEVAGMLAGAVV